MSDNSSSPVLTTKKAWICWSGALLPVVLSFVAQLAGPQAQAAPEPRPKPSLIFSQYMIDQGEPPVEPIYRAAFEFRNLGDRDITIKELKPSCGCLKPQLHSSPEASLPDLEKRKARGPDGPEKTVYKPGEMGEFWIRVDPTLEKPGPREYFVDVHYEDPDPHTIRVTYKIVLPEKKVEITPKALVFYQLEGNEAETEQDVFISDYRDSSFHILSMESTSPLARAMLVKTENDEAGNTHHHLRVTVSGKVPPGTSRALINIRTDDPDFKLLQVPILISGPRPLISKADLPLKVDPESLFLQTDAGRTVETSLMFYDFQPQPVELKQVSLTSFDGTAEAGPVEQSPLGPLVRQRKILLSLKIPPSVKEHKGLLVIETDSQLQPRIEVPIVIQVP